MRARARAGEWVRERERESPRTRARPDSLRGHALRVNSWASRAAFVRSSLVRCLASAVLIRSTLSYGLAGLLAAGTLFCDVSRVLFEILQKLIGCSLCYLLSHLRPLDFVYTVFSVILNLLKPALHEVSKYPGATSITGPRVLKRSKLHSGNPQLLGTTAQIQSPRRLGARNLCTPALNYIITTLSGTGE